MDDEVAAVKRLYKKYQVDYPVLMGDPQLAERFGGVLGLPLSYLIDSEGRVVARYQGDVNLKQLELQIKALLPRQ
jgi:cytochrome c biogenesis protein CcmG/thiol:disulfide interchange protein DsbE